MNPKIVVALAGNPNSGKTTLFNELTGARQHVGNYPGVTVERKEGYCRHGDTELQIVDLPGTYSLTAYSAEELVARNFVIEEKPDVVVDIIDASNLERNLYLAVQLMELGVPLVLAFNMSDMAKARGYEFDIEKLSEFFGAPRRNIHGRERDRFSHFGRCDSLDSPVVLSVIQRQGQAMRLWGGLPEVRHLLSARDKGQREMTAYEVLQKNLGELQAILMEHECILNHLKAGDQEPVLHRCVSGCPHKQRMKETLLEAIHVLEESRKAFKSKSLEALRMKLIQVLSETD